MTTNRRIHWLAPGTVLFSLAAGILFALGHHLFYASLDGKAVQSDHLDILGTHVSKQQVNITAGTIFSYLVNFFLGTALATAYAQVFWRALLRSHATLETWDAAFSANSNVFFLGKVWVWWQFPLLFIVLIVAWLMPLASTIPPGTLSIGLAKIEPPPTSLHHVPNVDFISLNYVASMPKADDAEGGSETSQHQTQYQYNGPSTDVQRITDQVAQTGEILPITPPYSNASWTLDFNGPALKCATVSESTQDTVRQRLKSTASDGTCALQGYIAWSGSDTYKLPSNVSISFDDVDGLAINLASFPHMLDLVSSTLGNDLTYIPYTLGCYTGPNAGLDNPERFADSSMMQCQLHNATYHVSFDYVNGNQTVEITTGLINDDVIKPLKFVRGLGTQFQDEVMHDGVDCSILAGGFEDIDPNDYCRIDTRLLKTLSYQAIFDAFYNVVNGSVSRGQADTTQTVETSVENSVLVETPELRFLTSPTENFPNLSTKPLQEYFLASHQSNYQGLVNEVHTLRFNSLMQTIETLFQNITVSMMSSNVLQPNATSNFKPEPVQVERKDVHNVYVYSSARLWISYGIAIFFAAVAAAVGMWAFITNGVSYSQDFSTVFRVARGATMSEEVKTEDFDGRDPLPKYLKSSRVGLGPVKVSEKESKEKIQGESRTGSSDNSEIATSPTTVERTAGDPNTGT